jgi:molybdopterin/thiamine biosynthesis adenylyltransferase
MKGFRPNESGKFLFDKLKVINHNVELDWVSSENWNAEQISARGRFPVSFSSQRVLIIGCGAVGSVVAELLVRGNINQVVLIDGEELEVGNLVRHTLGLEDIKKPKAQQLAKRLNSINPNARVMYIADVFPPRSDNDRAILKQCDVIIDCTGDDKALISLSQFPWGKEKLIISINLNYGATKSFIFTYKGNLFPVQEYSQRIKPHLTNMDEIDELPIDGIGCWHPVFPARADDVWLLVSACVKEVLDSLEHPINPETCRFAVFEQVLENDTFVGIRKIG